MTKVSSTAIKKILKEIQSLQEEPPEDIQIILNEENLTEIQAWIRGPDGTPYEGGYFKVRLSLDESFPATPPKGHFMTKIFHPNVSSTGEICVNTLKKDWKSHLGIEHVLLTIKCLLIVPNPESALNEEAGKLLLEQYEDYAKRAKLYTSIHAKSGKSEFLALSKERSNNQENQTEENSNKTKEKSTATTPDNHVLKPLSDNPSIAVKKRLKEEENSSNKKKLKKVDKKKNLRRL